MDVNNVLILDCEVKKCIPPPWWKPDPLSEQSIAEQYFEAQIQYIENTKGAWSASFLNQKIDKLHDEVFISPGVFYEYCAGFDDFENMGMAICTVWDMKTNSPLVFFDSEEDLDDLQDLIKDRETIVGYNNVKFDNKLIKAQGIEMKPSFDLLRALWRQAGLDPNNFNKDTHKGYGLDALSAMNSGHKKTGRGADAPRLWQKGKLGEVIRYGMNDVMLLRSVFMRAMNGTLLHPITGENVQLKVELEY